MIFDYTPPYQAPYCYSYCFCSVSKKKRKIGPLNNISRIDLLINIRSSIFLPHVLLHEVGGRAARGMHLFSASIAKDLSYISCKIYVYGSRALPGLKQNFSIKLNTKYIITWQSCKSQTCLFFIFFLFARSNFAQTPNVRWTRYGRLWNQIASLRPKKAFEFRDSSFSPGQGVRSFETFGEHKIR